MPKDFVDKMAKYVAWLRREADVWEEATDRQDMVDLFATKLETCRDICAMFGCRAEVWKKVEEIYDFKEETK